jgi:hypothetical protein
MLEPFSRSVNGVVFVICLHYDNMFWFRLEKETEKASHY